MLLKFTIHCQVRLLERVLNVEHIKQAIRSPDKKKEQEEGKYKVWKQVGTKQIVVVYCNEGFRDRKNEYIVITAYYI